MDHPLTPREKVAKEIVDRTGVGTLGLTYEASRTLALDIADAILTALASGSGDHAELARLADMADWMADGDPGANGSVLLSASVASEHASDLKALLAENAVLRAKIQTEIKLSVDNYVRATARATEAERKLAEAVGLLRDLASWFDGSAYNGAWVIRSGDLGVDDAICAARTFLSKEAERG